MDKLLNGPLEYLLTHLDVSGSDEAVSTDESFHDASERPCLSFVVVCQQHYVSSFYLGTFISPFLTRVEDTLFATHSRIGIPTVVGTAKA